MSTLPSVWKNWVVKSLLQGQQAGQIASTLLNNGFMLEDCQQLLGSSLGDVSAVVRNKDYYINLAHPQLIDHLHQYNGVVIEQDRAQIYGIAQFLSLQECDDIIEIAKSQLRASTISAKSGYEGFRTSTTCDLSEMEHPLVKSLEKRIIDCLGLKVGTREMMQAQHYAPGQQFKTHTDYFEPGAEEYRQHASERGQRSWTFMLYLNHCEEGGETEFTDLGLKFKPVTGSALIWNNLLPSGHPNPLTAHRSHPVISGEKVIITKWFRDR
ncbi:2OG-Fe(II) oxygenase [Neptunicella marina]|uniref:2OG-Fe(II) oxygenase n=1 Tax=Neptunicella marina TaxID=2125989 RepID=A0A8J6ISK4_9ALTE|nr:2OG-Fe(II) oxygenase [Neptunicella marina]MBC3764831.1 2OG-Fe(II) oxygenase [Neptunicella marina]